MMEGRKIINNTPSSVAADQLCLPEKDSQAAIC